MKRDLKDISKGTMIGIFSASVLAIAALLASMYIFMNYTQPAVDKDINNRIDTVGRSMNDINRQISKDRYVSKEYYKDVIESINKLNKSVTKSNQKITKTNKMVIENTKVLKFMIKKLREMKPYQDIFDLTENKDTSYVKRNKVIQ